MHFGRRLAAWRHQEIELQAVDDFFLTGFDDWLGWGNDSRQTCCQRDAQTVADISLWVTRQKQTVGEQSTATHNIAQQYVFADGFFHKACRGDNLHFARYHVIFRDNAFHTAIVIGMAMGINNGNNRFLRTMLIVEVKAGFCCPSGN